VNITHLVENLNRGGLERVVIDLVREQVAEGHRVDVICLFEEGQLAPELDVPIYAARKGGGFDVGAIRRVRARLKERGSAVLHTHNAMAHYYGMLAAIGLPIACRINTRHNMSGLGGGSLRDELEAFAAEQGVADRVRFLGDRSDVRELLRGFDLLAVSSRTEGYSVVLVEASAVGLPIVATRVGGNAEIVRDGVSGLVVPPSDPAALAAGMRALLDDAARASRMGEAARAWALGEGSVETMARRYEAIYRAAGAS
jgi:glycosyltransferase involved in cell wall biosynthesis